MIPGTATYADLLRPHHKIAAYLYDGIVILGGSLAIAMAAQLAVRLPFTPVPISAQTLAVLLVGALLGCNRGSLAVAAYIAEGAMGLPVFANGSFGIQQVLGPTGGYLFGFVAAAAIVGWLSERGLDRRFITTLAAMLLGSAAIYVAGVAWLGAYFGFAQALKLGVYPFIVGDGFKILLAASMLPLGWRVLQRLPSFRH